MGYLVICPTCGGKMSVNADRCPHCGETIYFDEDMLTEDGALICPNCNKPVIPAAEDLQDEE